jgi:predicted nucleotidyltransferase
MSPTEKLKKHKKEVLEILSKYEQKSFANIMLFGSVAKQVDTDDSDIDLAFKID